MNNSILINLENICLRFSKENLFENLSLNIYEKQKISLIGKNGCGKTSLMNIIAGEIEIDSGKINNNKKNIKIGYLKQNKDFTSYNKFTIEEYLSKDTTIIEDLENCYHKINILLDELKLNKSKIISNLSGGEIKKLAIIELFIHNYDLLLLDEPTNHLDFDTILWLEQYLRSTSSAIMIISHDRKLLENISENVIWFDRGNLRICPKGYKYFQEWSSNLLKQEQKRLENKENIILIEEEWAGRGVKARVKRNVARLNNVKKEREKLERDKRSLRSAMESVKINNISYRKKSSKLLIEFINVSKSLNNNIILDNFDLKIFLGERIGIIGKNGSGKSSFLKMIINLIRPDKGKIKLAKEIDIGYFDQKRLDLDIDKTIAENLTDSGSNYINVNGKSRHICSYLKDFLFDPKIINNKLSTLSGGEKNRLLLSKILAKDCNLIILDEPTNDLDMDMIDILSKILSSYNATLILVSHDRDFLEKNCNKIFLFDISKNNPSIYNSTEEYYNIDKKSKENNNQILSNNIAIKNKSPQNKSLPGRNKIKYEIEKIIKEIEQKTDLLEELNTEIIKYNKKEDIDKISIISADVNKLEQKWYELEKMLD